MAPAIPYIVLGTSIVQAQQQNAAGKYNQAIQNRNAQIAEQEAGAIDKEQNFNLVNLIKTTIDLLAEQKYQLLKLE